jgi:hypothetical protein
MPRYLPFQLMPGKRLFTQDSDFLGSLTEASSVIVERQATVSQLRAVHGSFT